MGFTKCTTRIDFLGNFCSMYVEFEKGDLVIRHKQCIHSKRNGPDFNGFAETYGCMRDRCDEDWFAYLPLWPNRTMFLTLYPCTFGTAFACQWGVAAYIAIMRLYRRQHPVEPKLREEHESSLILDIITATRSLEAVSSPHSPTLPKLRGRNYAVPGFLL